MIGPFEADENPDISTESPEHSHIEPLFWGTSNLLCWDEQALFAAIEARVAENEADSGKKQNQPQHNNLLSTASFKKALTLLPQNCIEARGIYGYFPIITEHGSLVVLNPSDFQSEMTILSFDRLYNDVVESCYENGDIIAMSGTTLGIEFAKEISRHDRSPKEITLLQEFGIQMQQFLNERCAMEIRRGMEIESVAGAYFEASTILKKSTSLTPLFEMMSIEERLGMIINEKDTDKIEPHHSSFSLFFPRYITKVQKSRTKM